MDFSGVKNYLDNIDKNIVPSLRLIVKKGTETVFDYFSARKDVYESEKNKDLYYLFSLSKVITCTAAMKLIEDNKMSLDDPVYKYLPEYENLYIGGSYQECHKVIDKEAMPKAKNTLTLKHLFTMGGGFTYDLGHPEILKVLEETNGQATTRDIAMAIAKMPLLFEPGENYTYSLCHDIIGAIIEVVSGKSFFDYLDEIIFTPLDMKDTFFQPDENHLKRMHAQFRIDPDFFIAKEQKKACAYSLSKKYESGGAGLVSTADDYIKFVSCLANGESESGYSILKRESIDIMRTPRLCEKAQKSFAINPTKAGYSYGLGVRTHVDPHLSHGLSPIGEYGWDGAAGAYALIDPENKISLIYTQHVMGCGYAYSHIHPTIRNLVYKAMEK